MERYRVGDIVVDVPKGAVTRHGQRLSVPPLTFNLLVALIRRAPDVVGRRELLDTVWTGEIVSDAALSQRVSLLRQVLGDRSRPPRYIGSARGWGYSIVAPVDRIAARQRIATLAVMPFLNLSNGSEDDAFADGLTQAVITALSKAGELDVVSRTATLRYRHSEKSMTEIGRELGVDGVVDGSVLQAGRRVWISAQLVHAGTDNHVWAQTYQRDTADIVTLLDEVAAAVAGEIGAAVATAET